MKKITLSALVVATLGLSACGETGLLATRSAPDEMAVVAGPKLSLPPNFELRPPKTKEEIAKEERLNSNVKKMLTGSAQVASGNTNTADDSWLIQKAGGDARDPNIRKKMRGDEAFEMRQNQRSWWDKQKDKMLGAEEEHPAVKELGDE